MLHDLFGRRFPYLRLSVTDICNFRCQYCLPDGNESSSCQNEFLNPTEIKHLIAGFARLGVKKVRLTGGEPIIRKDLLTIAEHIANTPGIEKLAITTNGYRLKQMAPQLKKVGIQSLNISVDSLDPQLFHTITGHNRLQEILDAIDLARELDFKPIKINTVLLKNLNDHELESFIHWVKNRPVHLRFIELMQTGDNQDFFQKHHLSSDIISGYLKKHGWQPAIRDKADGPAVSYYHPDAMGRIGIIAPYSKNFCQTCNRLRVTAKGHLRLCLFGDKDYNLRPFLQSPHQQQQLIDAILCALQFKKSTHYLQDNETGLTKNLATLGG